MPDSSRMTQELLQSEGLQFSDQQKNILDAVGNATNAWGPVAAGIYSSKLLERALDKHAAALKEAADATDANSKSLTRATWILAAATVVLAVATVALVAVTIGLWLFPRLQ